MKRVVHSFELGAVLVVPPVAVAADPFGVGRLVWVNVGRKHGVILLADGANPGGHVAEVVKT